MKILYLSHRIPYPPNKGDKIRSFNEIKFLSQDHEIHLACTADDPADVKYEMELGRYCKKTAVEPIQKSICKAKTALHIFSGAPLSVGYFYSRKLQKTIDHWLSMHAYDAVLCFSSPMAEYLFRSPLIPPSHIPKQNSKFEIRNSKLVMDFCDVDSDKWLQYARQSPFPLNMIYGLEHRRLSAYETKITRCFDHSVFVSRQEADLFLQKHPQAKNVSVITNGVDDEYFAARPPGRPAAHLKPATRNPQPATRNPQPVLLFTGAMDYHANAEGVAWFSKEIYPLIKAEFENTQFHIVGSNPIPSIRALADPNGIKVTGFVEDIRPYYTAADICVVPLRLARGIQNKVLEAMAMAKPVVTTAKAAEGIAAKAGEHLLVADSPVEFARAVTGLIENRDAAVRIGANAARFVRENYNWPENMKKFEDLLKQ